MLLSLATTWDNTLLEGVHALNNTYGNIGSIFGSAAFSWLGNARHGATLPQVSLEQQEAHIMLAHQYGLEFIYTVNAPCLGNQEYTTRGQQSILRFFGQLCEIGVDWVVLSVPYLIEVVKRKFPQLRVKVSVINRVNSMRSLQQYASLGVDAITLDWDVNRDLRFLKQAAKFASAGGPEIELLATDQCLYGCSFRLYHYNVLGHTSQVHSESRAYVDYPCIRCSLIKFSQPVELIRSRWIRPEDLELYEELEIYRFKIGYRTASTKRNLEIAQAYAARRFDGNILELIFGPGIPFYLNNRELDGFLEFFRKQDCRVYCGIACTYCDQLAGKIELLDSREVRGEIEKLGMLSERLVTCSLYEF